MADEQSIIKILKQRRKKAFKELEKQMRQMYLRYLKSD